MNYAGIFLEVLGLLPCTYDMVSFNFMEHDEHWDFDTRIFSQDDRFYDEIPRIRILKKAFIRDFYSKNRPGKYLRIGV